MKKARETLVAEVKDLKYSQAKTNTVTEMQNWLVIITMKIVEAVENTGDIKGKIMENKAAVKKRERIILDYEDRFR